jgi:2'-hydroxyisoflavone reductase
MTSSQPLRDEALVARAGKSLNLLILGGTGFLGPHMVAAALARGHRITLFNRGHDTGTAADPRIETLNGNRDPRVGAGLAALAGTRRWDVVIDNSGYVPRQVHDSVGLLRGRIGRYIFVSTVSVYDSPAGATIDEHSPLLVAPDPGVETVSATTYGPLKAESDRIVRAALGDQATVVRPNYIVGPGDHTDRFTYWVERIFRGGDVLGPPHPTAGLQWVDARDLCPWIITLAERDQAGVFNASGPVQPVSWERLLHELVTLSPVPAGIRYATPEVMAQTGIQLPLVDPDGGTLDISGSAAAAAGLNYRPLADTARATHAWWQAQPEERRRSAQRWPTAELEQEALRRL